MDPDDRRNEAGGDNLFLDPLHHVVASATLIVPRIVIKTDDLDRPRSK